MSSKQELSDEGVKYVKPFSVEIAKRLKLELSAKGAMCSNLELSAEGAISLKIYSLAPKARCVHSHILPLKGRYLQISNSAQAVRKGWCNCQCEFFADACCFLRYEMLLDEYLYTHILSSSKCVGKPLGDFIGPK